MSDSDLWVYEDDETSLWPKRRYDDRDLHGVAFPDVEHNDPECLIVRYVGKDEADARAFAAEKGGTYVYALEESIITRTDWEIRPKESQQ